MRSQIVFNPAQIDALTAINTDDIFAALGWSQVRRGRRLLAAAVRGPARRFAYEAAEFDRRVGADGLPAGAAWMLGQFLRELQAAGQEQLPAAGPLLILANHPGMVDTVALFVSVGRPDLRILALERPFLKALPNVSRQLLYVPEDERARLPVVRAAAAALRAGQAVLNFPAGGIEPDPAVLPGASAALERWSESVSIFARLAPETQVAVAMVSGVLSPAAQRHPLTRLRRTQKDREHLAAMLQVMFAAYKGVTVRVAFSAPRPARELLAAPDLKAEIVRAARRLIEPPPAQWQTVLRGQR